MTKLARLIGRLRRWIPPPEPAGVGTSVGASVGASVGTSVAGAVSVGAVVGASVVVVVGGRVCFGFFVFDGPTVTSGPDCRGPDCSGPDSSAAIDAPDDTAAVREDAGETPTQP